MKQYAKLYMIIINMLFTISAGCFTVLISINDDYILIILSFIISILSASYVCIKKKFGVNCIDRIKLLESIISVYFTLRIMYEFSKKDFIFINELVNSEKSEQIIKFSLIIISSIFIFFIIVFFIKEIYAMIRKFIINMDRQEKYYFLLTILLGSIFISIVYTITNGFEQQYDSVYSMDSGYVTNKILPKLYYFDIRHTLLSILTFPIGRMFRDIELFLGYRSGLQMIFWGIFNLNLLTIMAILLKRLTDSKWILLIYTVSNPFLLYALMIEKYQLCTFFVVVFIYAMIKKDNSLSEKSFFIATGAMTTTAVMGIFFGDGYKLKDRIIKYLNVVFKFALLLVILGRISVLTSGFQLVKHTMDRFGGKMSITNRIYSCFDLIASCFTATNYSITKKGFYWVNPSMELNYFGLFILLFIIIAFMLNKQNKFAQICFYWIVFLFVLFVGLGWSVHESQLFSIYFSWAVISVVVMGIEKVLNNDMIKKSIFYGIALLMISVNLPHMINMIRYLSINFPRILS